MPGFGCSKSERHPNQPLCHVMWAASIVFDVVAKFCAEATNLLKFCMAGSDGLDLALGEGAAGLNCVAGISRVCNGSG